MTLVMMDEVEWMVFQVLLVSPAEMVNGYEMSYVLFIVISEKKYIYSRVNLVIHRVFKVLSLVHAVIQVYLVVLVLL